MQELHSSKSKNTALNSRGEEEEEKIKNVKEQAKKPEQCRRQVLCLLVFFLILSLALHLCLQHLYF